MGMIKNDPTLSYDFELRDGLLEQGYVGHGFIKKVLRNFLSV